MEGGGKVISGQGSVVGHVGGGQVVGSIVGVHVISGQVVGEGIGGQVEGSGLVSPEIACMMVCTLYCCKYKLTCNVWY